MTPNNLSDEQLLGLVVTADKELFDAGMDMSERAMRVPISVMEKLGYVGFVVAGTDTPLILRRIQSAFESIYRKQDIAIGGHIGVFMYRDVFARISVPIIFGQVCLDPFNFVELTPLQRRILQTEQDQKEIYLDQFFDVTDVEYGTRELRVEFVNTELVVRFIELSRLHLHSASAILTGGYDHRGAAQAALLATELALKAGAAAHGLSEYEIKNQFGHKSHDTAEFIGSKWKSFDLARVKRVISAQPAFVPNRYSAVQPDRRKVGHLVMGAQYIASEVVRQMSERDCRMTSGLSLGRRYPA